MPSPTTTTIRTYLDLIAQPRKRGRRPAGAEEVAQKLEQVKSELEHAQGLDYVHLCQRKLDLEERLQELNGPAGPDLAEAEEAFVEHVAEWAVAKGVSYSALRTVGVPAGVLRRAGMKP